MTVDERAVRGYRLRRVREQLAARDLAGIVIFDPVNLRYATGSRNMQVWTKNNFCRYAVVLNGGPVILFDLSSSRHLAESLETVDEIRPALAWDYAMVGDRNAELAGRWASEIADLITMHGGGNRRVAIDRADWLAAQALTRLGVDIVDGKAVMERARAVKSADEIAAMRIAFGALDESVAVMRDMIEPGIRECDALAALLAANVARGGEYPETRLLTSGPRTNPWFQETSDRLMAAGDLLSFDTDLIGPHGIYSDISRSWVVGGGKPSDEQRRLYETAVRQLDHNAGLLRPGLGFVEYAEKSYRLPDEYIPNRYADVAHGCGLGVEYPYIWYPEDADLGMYDGVFEAGMVVCVECYVGAPGGREGVKLEQAYLISDNGPECLSDYPIETDYL
ncbi:MAG: Xaa-Pro peptidase family protein [Rhodospirillales bacterium]